jgi:hypothetical protein
MFNCKVTDKTETKLGYENPLFVGQGTPLCNDLTTKVYLTLLFVGQSTRRNGPAGVSEIHQFTLVR